MTYKEAFDKVTEAYIKGEIKPLYSGFCFCGTLCNNSSKWFGTLGHHRNYGDYTGTEYRRMEMALFNGIEEVCGAGSLEAIGLTGECKVDNYEEGLFNGMCEALKVLKRIHIEKGENVEESLKLNKRQLTTI